MVLPKNLTLRDERKFLDVFWSSQRKDTSPENSAFCALPLRKSSITHICILSLTVIEELHRHPLSVWGFILFILHQTKGLNGHRHEYKILERSHQHRQANWKNRVRHTQWLCWFRVWLSDKHTQPGSTDASVLLMSCPSIWPTEKRFGGWWGDGVERRWHMLLYDLLIQKKLQ